MDRLWTWTERSRDALREWMRSGDLLRAGLIAGTVAIASGGFGALLFFSAGQSEGEAGVAAAPVPDSRLPRPRPDEPVITGSIQTSAEADRESEPDARERQARGRRFDDLQTRAILIASSWSECDQVEDSELFELPGGIPDDILVRIHCANGTRFVLGEADIASNRIASAEPPATNASALQPAPVAVIAPPMPPPTDIEVVRACEDKVRQGLPFPTSLNRAFSTTGVARMPDGEAIVSFDFDALNGFGFPLLMRVQCVFADRELARLELMPR